MYYHLLYKYLVFQILKYHLLFIYYYHIINLYSILYYLNYYKIEINRKKPLQKCDVSGF